MASYKCVDKLNTPTGEWEALCPLRVVSFAYELGHKLAFEDGPGTVCPDDLKRVRVSGKVRVLKSRSWKRLPSYSATAAFLRRFVRRLTWRTLRKSA